MPEYSGSLQSFELALALWLAPLLPLVGAVYAAVGGFVGGNDDRGLAKSFQPRVVTLVSAIAALGLVTFHLAVLLGLPADQRQLVSHAWGMQRIGSLDTSFTFSCDPTTIGLAVVISVAAIAGSLLMRDSRRERAESGGIGLSLSGGLFVVLGDDLILMLAGSLLCGIGALLLAAGDSARRAARGFVLARTGDAALLSAIVALSWGLAGSWTGDGDYVPDFRARLVAVQVGDAPPPAEKERGAVRDALGSITMGALPGASVVLGGAELCAKDPEGKRGGVGTSGRPCREVARAPFSRLPVPVALHDIEIRTGPGTHDLEVEKARVSANVETMIVVAGATTVVREIRDQLSLRDGSGTHPLRVLLAKRKIAGQPLLGFVAALLAVFVLLRGLSAAWAASQRAAAESSAPSLAALGGGIELWVAAGLILRVDFLFSFVPGTATAIAAVSALAALIAAAQAAHGFDARRTLALLVVANAALSAASFLLGAHVAGVVGVITTALGLLGVVLLLGTGSGDLRQLLGSAKARQRAMFLSALAMAGAPVPLLGVFWARDGLLAAATSTGTWLGYLTVLLAALASGSVAFAVWRVHYLVTTGKSSSDSAIHPRLESAALALAATGLAVGALAHASAVTGDAVPSVLETWLASTAAVDFRGAPLERSVRLAIAALAFVPGLVGFAMARARYGEARAKDWAKREAERPLFDRLATSRDLFDASVTRPALAVAHLVRRFDEALELSSVGPTPPERDPAPAPTTEQKREADE